MQNGQLNLEPRFVEIKCIHDQNYCSMSKTMGKLKRDKIRKSPFNCKNEGKGKEAK